MSIKEMLYSAIYQGPTPQCRLQGNDIGISSIWMESVQIPWGGKASYIYTSSTLWHLEPCLSVRHWGVNSTRLSMEYATILNGVLNVLWMRTSKQHVNQCHCGSVYTEGLQSWSLWSLRTPSQVTVEAYNNVKWLEGCKRRNIRNLIEVRGLYTKWQLGWKCSGILCFIWGVRAL